MTLIAGTVANNAGKAITGTSGVIINGTAGTITNRESITVSDGPATELAVGGRLNTTAASGVVGGL